MGFSPLSREEVLDGNGGVTFENGYLENDGQQELAENTPLWFYILRDAEVAGQGRLTNVGATIVAETFHRAIEAGANLILADLAFQPFLGQSAPRFDMSDLLFYAFDGRADLLNPHRDNGLTMARRPAQPR